MLGIAVMLLIRSFVEIDVLHPYVVGSFLLYYAAGLLAVPRGERIRARHQLAMTRHMCTRHEGCSAAEQGILAMNVLFAGGNGYYPEFHGGVQSSTHHLVEQLRSRGHRRRCWQRFLATAFSA